jgi:hypothetical protein
MRQHVVGRPRVPIRARLTFSATDPLVVTVVFTSTNGAEVQWVIGRDLLHCGLHHEAGEGDVRVRPLEQGRVSLRVRSQGAQAEFDTDRGLVHSWLSLCYEAVPQEDETRDIDWEAELAWLLAEAPSPSDD